MSKTPALSVPKWFERNFDFSFPVDYYPNVLIRLAGTPARLEELTRSRSAHSNSLIAKPEGEWSAQEHAGHLADLEPLWATRVDDFLGKSATLAAADLTNRKTHEAHHNRRELAEILSAFRRSRLYLFDCLAKLEGDTFARTLVHPRLQQPMRLVDHLYFVAEHDDHHLATIWQLLHT